MSFKWKRIIDSVEPPLSEELVTAIHTYASYRSHLCSGDPSRLLPPDLDKLNAQPAKADGDQGADDPLAQQECSAKRNQEESTDLFHLMEPNSLYLIGLIIREYAFSSMLQLANQKDYRPRSQERLLDPLVVSIQTGLPCSKNTKKKVPKVKVPKVKVPKVKVPKKEAPVIERPSELIWVMENEDLPPVIIKPIKKRGKRVLYWLPSTSPNLPKDPDSGSDYATLPPNITERDEQTSSLLDKPVDHKAVEIKAPANVQKTTETKSLVPPLRRSLRSRRPPVKD